MDLMEECERRLLDLVAEGMTFALDNSWTCAARCWHDALALAGWLLSQERSSFRRWRDLAEVLERVAYAHRRLGSAKRNTFYSQALAVRIKVRNMQGRYGQAGRELALCLRSYSELLLLDEDYGDAFDYGLLSVTIFRQRYIVFEGHQGTAGELRRALLLLASAAEGIGMADMARRYRDQAAGLLIQDCV